jgi:cell division protein YceG involved in septum cleavage
MDDYSDPFAEEQAEQERRRRRAEREARRRDGRAKRSEQQGALADRVKGMLSGSTEGGTEGPDPRIGASPGARSASHEPEAGGEPPPPPPPPPPRTALGPRQPPSPPPRGPRNVRRRRIIGAVIVLIVAIGIVAGAAAAIHHFSAGSSDSPAPKQSVAGPVKKVTIPEGYDRRAIADLAKKDGITGDYMKASESFKGFNPDRYGAQNPSSLEGFLFPATYDLPHKPNVDDLISRQLDAFSQYMDQVNMKYAKSKNLTPYDVLIIASMIEREAVVDKDRKLIAAVIYNRLHQGMPLQIDATIRFAENNWTKPLTESDLHISSPYNTYENTGLPPTPIGNPGLASIEAAAHPASVNYLYYVAKPNGCGHFFTASYSAFQAAQARYNSAREAAGGNSPTNCP